MKAIEGWILDEDLDVFRIPIKIQNPLNEKSIFKYCLFDTGFSGYLGLDSQTISNLDLPKLGKGQGVTVKGIIDYKNFEGIVSIMGNDKQNLANVGRLDIKNPQNQNNTVPIQEFKIPILGLKSIKQFSWLILSDKRAIFLLK